jgi:hypothetical protein
MKQILTFLALVVLCGAVFAAVTLATLIFLFTYPLVFVSGLAGLAIASLLWSVGSNPSAEDEGW